MSARHKTIFILLSVLAATAFAAVGVFLATFDLDDYRHQFERKLSSALSRPVRLAEVHFTWQGGPSFAFSDLHLESSKTSAWDLQAESIFLRPSFFSLLRGKFLFNQVTLEGPQIRIFLPADSRAGIADFSRHFPEIRTLTVRNGSILVLDRQAPEKLPPIRLDRLEASLTDLAPDRPGWLSLQARLMQADGAAMIRLAGEITPAGEWRRARGHLGLKIEHWAPGPLLAALASETAASGHLSLQLTLSGSPATGLRFESEMAGAGVTLALPGRRAPLPLQTARMRGTWTASPDGGRLSNFDLVLDRLAGRGNLAWRHERGQLRLEASLSTPALPVPDLLRWLPESWPLTSRLRDHLRGGLLEIRSAHFAGFPAENSDSEVGFPLNAELAVRDLSLQGPFGTLEELAFSATLEQNRLDVTEGTLRYLESPAAFSGSIAEPFGKRPKITAQAAGAVESGELLERLAPDGRADFSLQGETGLHLAVAGGREKFDIDLQADLSAVQIRFGHDIVKKPGEEGRLQLAGELTPERFELRQAGLRLPVLDLDGRGRLDLHGAQAFQLSAELSAPDLQAARGRLKLLRVLQARGALAVQVKLAGAEGEIRRRTGTVQLQQAGMRLGSGLADLKDLSGIMRLSGDQLVVENLSGRLGNSPVLLGGSLIDMAEAEIRLKIRAETVRADELIFRSPTIRLHDLDADLRFDRRRISFERIAVRLDGGTRAVVRGDIDDFRRPVVRLDIAAAKGNIDEVIALWRGPAKQAAGKGKGRGEGVPVWISARVDEGTLGNLRFQQAEGHISFENGHLDIFPLQFQAEGGQCAGRVQVTTGRSPAFLQVSGHVEEMESAGLHELLQDRGLIRGKLRGDFYLEGDIGKEFLGTSRGGISLEIEQGVLLRFKSLAKVFSLLNVSQIFSFQLPDMARDGMPFDRLTATMALDHGILATEDLFIDSQAMNLSLVGQADLNSRQMDFVLGVKPLRTVDKIVTRIPLAGWLLAGEEKALITAHFLVRGPSAEPEVLPVPITSVSEKVLGIFRRVLSLPGRMVEGIGGLAH